MKDNGNEKRRKELEYLGEDWFHEQMDKRPYWQPMKEEKWYEYGRTYKEKVPSGPRKYTLQFFEKEVDSWYEYEGEKYDVSQIEQLYGVDEEKILRVYEVNKFWVSNGDPTRVSETGRKYTRVLTTLDELEKAEDERRKIEPFSGLRIVGFRELENMRREEILPEREDGYKVKVITRYHEPVYNFFADDSLFGGDPFGDVDPETGLPKGAERYEIRRDVTLPVQQLPDISPLSEFEQIKPNPETFLFPEMVEEFEDSPIQFREEDWAKEERRPYDYWPKVESEKRPLKMLGGKDNKEIMYPGTDADMPYVSRDFREFIAWKNRFPNKTPRYNHGYMNRGMLNKRKAAGQLDYEWMRKDYDGDGQEDVLVWNSKGLKAFNGYTMGPARWKVDQDFYQDNQNLTKPPTRQQRQDWFKGKYGIPDVSYDPQTGEMIGYDNYKTFYNKDSAVMKRYKGYKIPLRKKSQYTSIRKYFVEIVMSPVYDAFKLGDVKIGLDAYNAILRKIYKGFMMSMTGGGRGLQYFNEFLDGTIHTTRASPTKGGEDKIDGVHKKPVAQLTDDELNENRRIKAQISKAIDAHFEQLIQNLTAQAYDLQGKVVSEIVAFVGRDKFEDGVEALYTFYFAYFGPDDFMTKAGEHGLAEQFNQIPEPIRKRIENRIFGKVQGSEQRRNKAYRELEQREARRQKVYGFESPRKKK